MAAAPKSFFISYSRQDTDVVEPLVSLLKTMGRKMFFDVQSLQGGDEWQTKLLAHLEAAQAVYVFWCRHAKRSPWVRKEWELAISRKKKIIPVLLDSTRLPGPLARFMWIDFRRADEETRHSRKTWMERKDPIRESVGKVAFRTGIGLALLSLAIYLGTDIHRGSGFVFWIILGASTFLLAVAGITRLRIFLRNRKEFAGATDGSSHHTIELIEGFDALMTSIKSELPENTGTQ